MMGQVQQPEAPETAPAAQDTQNANEQQDPDPEWEDWVYLSTNDQLAPDDHFQYLSDHRDPESSPDAPGWPDRVLPRLSVIPANLLDNQPDLNPCQCLQVQELVAPLGPFSQRTRCFECAKPVISLKNVTKQGQWMYFIFKLLQHWDCKYWSDFPSVRADKLAPWWEHYARFKYRRPARSYTWEITPAQVTS